MTVDLDADSERWPTFATEPRRQAFHAVFALPMRPRVQPIGAPNLFGSVPSITPKKNKPRTQ